MRFFRDLTLVILVLAGTVGFSQVPRFVQEYEQRLGGALQEARRQLGQYEGLAQRERVPLELFWRRLSENAVPSVAGVGEVIRGQAERAATLAEQADAMAAASRLEKPWVLLRGHDDELLAATWSKYEYTLTLEPAFAALGALAGLLLNAAFWGLLGLMRRQRGAAELGPPLRP